MGIRNLNVALESRKRSSRNIHIGKILKYINPFDQDVWDWRFDDSHLNSCCRKSRAKYRKALRRSVKRIEQRSINKQIQEELYGENN